MTKTIKAFVTWERATLLMMGVLTLVLGLTGRAIMGQMDAMHDTMHGLGEKISEVRVEVADRLGRLETKVDIIQRAQ